MASPRKVESSYLSPELSKKNLLIAGITLADIHLIKKSIEQGANVNEDWPFGNHTIFTKAVEKGNVEIIRCLLDSGASINNSGFVTNKITPLIAAIRNSSISTVKFLVENGADVNQFDGLGRTPLNEALTLNQTEVLKFLIMQGVCVNQSDRSGRPPIILAVANNNLEVVELLVSRGANIHKSDSDGNTAKTLAQRFNNLYICDFLEYRSTLTNSSIYSSTKRVRCDTRTEYDFLDEVQLILAEEATETTPKVEKTSEILTKSAPPGNNSKYEDSLNEKEEEEICFNKSSLLQAIFHDDVEGVKHLISQDRNLNDTDDEGFTPLIRAIQFESSKILKYLLTLRVNIYKTVHGKTPLQLAVQKNNLEIIQLLLQHGAEHTIQTAFMEAINLENVEIVKYFLQRQVNVNQTYKNGCTPLTKSIQKRNFEIVKLLVENGANVTISDASRNLPLTLALEVADVNILTYLVQKGAVLPNEPIKNSSYLREYIENGNLEMIKLLHVRPDVILQCGYCPLTKAADLGNLEMVKFFTEKFDCVNCVDGNKKTALSVSASNQDLPLIKYLIELGADTDLARKEIEECENSNEDFALYMKSRK